MKKRNRFFAYLVLAPALWLVVVGVRPRFALSMEDAQPPLVPVPLSAGAEVQRAWEKARQVGSYRYAIDVVQTAWPLPTLENVGLTATEERVYIEGQTNLPARTMEMKLWSDGGSAQTGQGSLDMRVVGDQAFGRIGADPWEEVEDFTGLFAPGNDLLGYLAGARNVVRGETGSSAGVTFTRYSFEMDGLAFARYMRGRMEDELRRKGTLPPGMRLDMARIYLDMTGGGEIWLDSEGLPLRQIVQVRFPPDRHEQVEASIETDFFDWGAGSTAVEASRGLPGVTREELKQAGLQAGLLVGFVGLIALVVAYRRSRKVYAVAVVFIAVSMVLTPLLEAHHVRAFFEELSAEQAEYERQRENSRASRQWRERLTSSDFDPHTDPFAGRPALPLGQDEGAGATLPALSRSPALLSSTMAPNQDTEDDGTDSDDDGLTDRQESPEEYGTDPNNPDTDGDGLKDGIEVNELGTSPNDSDTDGDLISDRVEVEGFSWYGQRWYLNPLDPDTNRDGQPDTVECAELTRIAAAGTFTACVDTDDDGTPDVFGFDDDGDGVPDSVDLSRTAVMGGGRDGLGRVIGLDDGTFHFKLNQMAVDTPTFVDLQFRPVAPDHLWYTLNVLDWPSGDVEGQIQRVFDTTFKDVHDRLGRESGSKEANGDLRLIPMLEIEIPYYDATHHGNLPTLPGAPALSASTPITAWLDTAQTDSFQISVKYKDEGGALLAYVPVNLVRDSTSDDPVAFSARMFYRPDSADFGFAQQVRFVWLVEMLTDYCEPPEGYTPGDEDADPREVWCDDRLHWQENPARVVHVYYDDWYLTGLAVREDRGVDVAVAFEDPDFADRDPNIDKYLWHLASNLDRTFITGRTTGQGVNERRDITVAEIDRRFDITSTATTTQRWGIPVGALRVETFAFPDQTHLATLPLTHTEQILDQYFLDSAGGTPQPKVDAPTLLYAREERYRAVNLETSEVISGTGNASVVDGVLLSNQVTVVIDPAQVQEKVLAGMNWAPYRFAGAGFWEPYPISEYWELIEDRFAALFEDDPVNDPEGYLEAGRILLSQNFYLAIYYGTSGIVEIGNVPIERELPDSSDTDLVLEIVADSSVVPIAIAKDMIAGAITSVRSLSRRLVYFGTTAEKVTAAIGGMKKGLQESWVDGLFDVEYYSKWRGPAALGLAAGFAVFGVGMCVLGAILSGDALETVSYVLDAINFVAQVKTVVEYAHNVYKATLDGKFQYGVIHAIRSEAVNLRSAANIVAIIGMIISAAISIGIFIAEMVCGGVKFASLAFNLALAAVVAQIIVGVIMLAIGFIPIVGPLIVAIIGLIDAVIGLVCKITGLDEYKADDPDDLGGKIVRDYVCGGISGALAKLVQFLIYSQNPVVDLEREERLEIANFDITMSDRYPAVGFVAGNRIELSADITTTLYTHWPVSPLAYTYGWHYTSKYVKQSSFEYGFAVAEEDLHDTRNLSTDRPSTWGGSPPFKRENLSSGYMFVFSDPGINQKVSAYLNEGHAINAQECFLVPNPIFPFIPPVIPICYLRDKSDTFHFDLDLKFDILPSTVGGLCEPVAKGDGHTLAWGESGDLTFPVQADADGDGLRSLAFGGDDPNDGLADIDGDGLSDYTEIRLANSDPVLLDTDYDGLTDYEELRYGANPRQADTDHDGLKDGAEVAGWEYVYDFDAQNQPLITHVTSDPLQYDTDGDGLSDKLEQVYGMNPRVAGPAAILSIESIIDDADGLVAPGQTIVYTATIANELKDRYALGLLEVEFPAALQNESLEPRFYELPPRQGSVASEATLMGSVTVDPAVTQSEVVSLTNRAGAIVANLREGVVDGRQLWLHLDENPGATTFVDDSLLGHHGACTGIRCPTAGAGGYSGRAMEFAGDDNVTVFPFDVPDQFEDHYTLSLWFKTTCHNCGLFSIANHQPSGAATTYDRSVYLKSGAVCASLAGEEICTQDGLDYGNDGWHNVVHVFGGVRGVQRLYVDGIEKRAGTVSHADMGWTMTVNVGYAPAAGQDYFTGRIDEVEVYPEAISDAEIESRFQLPVFHAKFDESSGVSTFVDASPYRHSIACASGACPSAGQTGVVGKAAAFDQTKYAYVAQSDALDLSQGDGQFTLAAWIYPQDADDQWRGVFGNENTFWAQYNYPSLFIRDGGWSGADPSIKYAYLKASFGDGSTLCEVTSDFSALTRNTWQHVVATFNGTLFRLYVNGQEVASSSACAGRRPYAVKTFDIGRTSSRTRLWLEKVVVENEGDGSGSAEYFIMVDALVPWSLTGIKGGYTYYIRQETIVYGDWNHTLRLYEDDSDECCRGDSDLNVSETFRNTSLGSFSQAYSEDGKGTFYWDVDNDFYKGRLDDVRIYRHALDPAGVVELYGGTLRSLETRFDEPPGASRFRDHSGNGNTGACSGDTCPTTGLGGRVNQAARFDGVDDYIDVPLDVPETGYAVSLLFRTSCRNCGIFSADAGTLGGGGNDRHIYLRQTGSIGDLCARVWSNETICTSGTDYADGRWHHVVHTVGSGVGGQKLYVDGQEKASGTKAASDFTGQTGINIGFSNDAVEDYFDGYIDHVVILRKALTLAEANGLAAEMPVLNMHFDEFLGDTTFGNQARQANDGACRGDCPAVGADGWMRGAAHFDGVDDIVSVDYYPGLSLGQFSIGMWVKPMGRRSNGQALLVKEGWGGGDRNYGLFIEPNSMRVNYRDARIDGGHTLTSTEDALIENQWSHVMVTYDRSTISLYINGRLDVYKDVMYPVFQSDDPVYIGGDSTDHVIPDTLFAGEIDEVVIYNYPLPRHEVEELYDYQVTWYDTAASHEITVDADDPTVTIDFALTHVDMSSGRRIAVRALDETSDVERVQYRINGAGWLEANRDGEVWIISFSPAFEGLHTIEARAYDTVGNQSAVESVSFVADGSPPAVAVDSALTQQALPAVQGTEVTPIPVYETLFPVASPYEAVYTEYYGWWYHPSYASGYRYLGTRSISRVDYEMIFSENTLQEGGHVDFALSINNTVVGTFSVLPGEMSKNVSLSFPPMGGWPYWLTLEVTYSTDWLGGIKIPLDACKLSFFSPETEPTESVELAGSAFDVGGSGVAAVWVELLNEAGEPVAGRQPASLSGDRWQIAYRVPHLTNGRYTVRLEAVDGVGNKTIRADETIGVDGTPALADLTYTEPLSSAVYGVGPNAPTIGGTVTDIPYPGDRRLHLHFEEAAGAAEFRDGSGRLLVGACSGVACPTADQAGALGRAARFDGTDYLVVDRTDFEPANYAILAWFKTGASAQQTIFAATDPADPTYGLWLKVGADGKLRHRYYPAGGSASQIASLGSYNDDAWHHVAVVKDGTALALYVDDQEVVTGTVGADFTTALDVAIGRLGKTLDGEYFNGVLDEIVLYERALTAEQVRAIVSPAASGVEELKISFRHAKDRNLLDHLAVYLPLDEDAGATTFADLRPVLHHGTCSGSACPTAGRPGKIGQALEFDGNDRVSLGNFEPGTDFTLAAWVKPDTTAGVRTILYHGLSNGGLDVFLRIKDGYYEFGERYHGSSEDVQAAYEIPPEDVGQWVHLAATYQHGYGGWLLYRNGQWVGTYSWGPRRDERFNTEWTIGANAAGDEFFDGLIDEVTIYDWVLDEDELSTLIDPLRWRDATLHSPGARFSTWSYQVPEGIEGPHVIDLRTTDQFGRTVIVPNVWSGEVDTWPPRAEWRIYAELNWPGHAYWISAEDYNLRDYDLTDKDGHSLAHAFDVEYQDADWYTALFTQTKPYRYPPHGRGLEDRGAPYTWTVCDLFDQCTSVVEGPNLLRASDSRTLQAQEGPPLAATGVTAMQAAPPLETAVFTPTAGSVLAPTEPITIEVYAYALDFLQALTVTVNGTPISTATWTCSTVTETLWSAPWTPAVEGVYTITAQVADCAGGVATDTTFAPVVYADVTPPGLVLATDSISGQNFTAAGYVVMSGLVSDTVGVRRVQVRVDERGWEDATVPTSTLAFDAAAWTGSSVPPSGESVTIAARATDLAGHVTEISRTVWADAVPPEPVTVTLAYTDSHGVRTAIAPGATVRDVLSPTLVMSWTGSGSGDVAGYLAGWTVTPTLSAGEIAGLSPYGPAAREHTQPAGEAQALYAHLVVEDTSGNQTVQALGPVYVDYTLTPAYVAMGDYTGWMEDGCSLIGVDRRAAQRDPGGTVRNAEQRLYLTWDAQALWLAWTGADWGDPSTASQGDGDLFVYLDTQAGGTSQAYNPYSAYTGTLVYLPGITPTLQLSGTPRAGAAASLMEADYLVWVKDTETAWLYRWDGGDWVTQTVLSAAQYRFDPVLNSGQTDLILPFDLIGLAGGGSLDLVAFASEDDALRLWAAMPSANPLSSERVVGTTAYAGDEPVFALSRQYHWDSLGPDLCPNGAYPDTDARVDVAVEPDGTVYSFLDDNLFWLWDPLLGSPPADVSSSFTFVDPNHPLLSDGQVVTYTVHYHNQGDDEAANVRVDLSAHYGLSLLDGASDHQVIALGDVGAGEVISHTFRGQVSLQGYRDCRLVAPPEDCASLLWAAADVLVYDDAHDESGPPVAWVWIDHQLDGTPPEFFGVRHPEHLVAAGTNPLRGYAYDAAGVPQVSLKMLPPSGVPQTLTCLDPTPQDGLWSCDWDTIATNGGTSPHDGDRFVVRLQVTDGFGLTNDWMLEPPITFTVDTVPPTVTLVLTESQVTTYTTLVNAGDFALVGRVADNRGLGHVEVCEKGKCARADVQLDPGLAAVAYDDVPVAAEAIGSAPACLARTFNVTESFPVGEVSLGLNITHILRDEVQAVLESPAGTQVQVVYGAGESSAAQNYDVLLNDAAAGGLHAGRGDNPAEPYYDRPARPYHPLRAFAGEGSAGAWTLTICDGDAAQHDGTYNRGRLVLKPQDTAARTGRWSYRASYDAAAEDYVEHTVSIYGVDLVGNRTDEPLTLSFAVDNVPPVITVTNQPDGAVVLFGDPTLLDGLVSDGGGIKAVWLTILDPHGSASAYPIEMGGEAGIAHAWVHTDTSRFVVEGDYSLFVEAEDEAGNRSAAGPFELTMREPRIVYLPIVLRGYEPEPSAPDLTVANLIVTDSDIRVVVKNEGEAPVTDPFWVDVYIGPNPAPTGVNQIWPDLADQGLVWGVTGDALPLEPGEIVTLIVGDAYYWAEYSQVSWPIPLHIPVYVQVDSANVGTTYGAVLEMHEISGGAYNNIAGPAYPNSEPPEPSARPLVVPPAAAKRWPAQYGLPPRPGLLSGPLGVLRSE